MSSAATLPPVAAMKRSLAANTTGDQLSERCHDSL